MEYRPRSGSAAAVAAEAALVPLVAWGALAFGAVYPWAYWPLLAGLSAVAIGGLVAPAPVGVPRTRAIAGGFVLFGLAVLLQLVPWLPAAVIERISPGSPQVTRPFDLAVVDRASGALSIAPARTWLGLACFTAFALVEGSR